MNRYCRVFVLASVGMFSCGLASGQDYPVKTVRLIVPFPPGGGADIIARIVGNKLAERLGQTVIIDNRPGAGGNIGSDAAAKAPVVRKNSSHRY